MNSWPALPLEETHDVPSRRICAPEELSGLENRGLTCAQSFFNNLFNDELIIHSAFLGEEEVGGEEKKNKHKNFIIFLIFPTKHKSLLHRFAQKHWKWVNAILNKQ